MWQLFISGLEGKNYIVTIEGDHPERTTVKELKSQVKDATGIEPDEQRLLYGGKQLQDDRTLMDYGSIGNHSNIMLVIRLKGGASTKFHRELVPDERCMITQEGSDEGIDVFKMPCGHAVCRDGLMDYVWNEVSMSCKSEVLCPLCSAEWTIQAIQFYGEVSRAEMQQLELGTSENFCKRSKDINQCPECKSYCTRVNPDVNNVKCIVCSKKKSSDYSFCWHCLREWKQSLSSSTCGNSGCDDGEKLAQLRNCGKKKVEYIDIEIYKFRACPSCGVVIELTGGCKHVNCKSCKVEFCFVCLRQKVQGSWQCGSHNTKCEPAPVQTVIPKRK